MSGTRPLRRQAQYTSNISTSLVDSSATTSPRSQSGIPQSVANRDRALLQFAVSKAGSVIDHDHGRFSRDFGWRGLPVHSLSFTGIWLYSCVVDHSDAEERMQYLLDALRTLADPDDPNWLPSSADARAVMEDGWATLDRRSFGEAGRGGDPASLHAVAAQRRGPGRSRDTSRAAVRCSISWKRLRATSRT